ncbi:MAG TPA: RNA degradosome polyphosphate kinase, partial [Pseudonocardiaceae bacterium]
MSAPGGPEAGIDGTTPERITPEPTTPEPTTPEALLADSAAPGPGPVEVFEDDEAPELPEDRFLNRELSWLDFNARVLALAEDQS